MEHNQWEDESPSLSRFRKFRPAGRRTPAQYLWEGDRNYLSQLAFAGPYSTYLLCLQLLTGTRDWVVFWRAAVYAHNTIQSPVTETQYLREIARAMNAPKLLLLCLFLTLPVAAQTATAELNGSVTDASGAVVANAKVTATNAETNSVREVTTDQAGNYVITLLPPGIYNLAVEAKGFKRAHQNNFELRVNQRGEINVQLQLGPASEAVEVQAAAATLESPALV